MVDVPGQVLGAAQELVAATSRLAFADRPFATLDILIVALLFYWIYFFLRATRAMRILYGMVILGILLLLGRLLDLTLLNFVMRYLLASILIAIPVVFQPELRAALERLGRTRFMTPGLSSLRRSEVDKSIDTIVYAVSGLSRRKIGALIAVTGHTGLRDVVETGVPLNADLSRELLWNIFTPKTPLHDGAAIVAGNKIVAAGARLPLSEEQFSEKMGTRHRAALGLAAQTDALVIVVSEETGRVSVAEGGLINPDVSLDALTERLKRFYHPFIRRDRHEGAYGEGPPR
jgi:diadenylate cyclase